MKPVVYVTNHPLSQRISESVLRGTNGIPSAPIKLEDGPAVCYGILRGTGDIIRQAYNSLHDFYHIDHGYMRRISWKDERTIAYGYFRITKNALGIFNATSNDSKRFDKLGIKLKSFKRGSKIVICELSDLWSKNHPWLKLDREEWLRNVVSEVRSYSDREIIIRSKSDGGLSGVLADCHCLICHSSNAAVEALVYGVPVIAIGESLASTSDYPFHSMEFIEQEIPTGDWEQLRHGILCAAANNQYTLEELSQKEVWDRILGGDTWNGHRARGLV